MAWMLPYTRYYRTMQRSWERKGTKQLDGLGETALERISIYLTRLDVEFDPAVEWRGIDALKETYEAGKGVLLIGPHTMLNRFALRWLHDSQIPFAAFSAGPFRVPGTLVDATTLPPGAVSLFRTRTLLKSGAVVAAMIDRMDPIKEQFANVKVGSRVMTVSDALVKLAIQQNSRIVFFASKLNGRGYPCVCFHAARADSSCPEVITQFAGFVARTLEDRTAGDSEQQHSDDRLSFNADASHWPSQSARSISREKIPSPYASVSG
jgi:lauroyl/myristoyl acyltransferase